MSSRASALSNRNLVRAGALSAALGLAALPAGSPASAQTIGNAGECATSRAQESLDRVGAAMFSWLLDVTSGLVEGAPIGTDLCPGAPPVDVTEVPPISVSDLRALLIPVYIESIPEKDPWGEDYEYRLNLANLLSFHVIALRSSGADRTFEGTTYDVGETSGPEDDLVLYNATRVRQPPRLDPVSRQRVTVERSEVLGEALLSWFTDVVSGATRAATGGPTVDLSLITQTTAADLATFLTPFYTQCVPALDGWGHPFDLRLNEDLLGSPVMSIRSAGSDGVLEGDVYDTEIFPADDFPRDLVWSDGQDFRTPALTRSTIFTDDFESAALWGTWSCGPGF